MLSAADKKSIFLSIPKALGESDVFVEYADRCNVSHELKSCPIVVTLRYFGDRPDKSRTPSNHLLAVQRTTNDIVQTKGEYQQVTLSLNVYAVGTTSQRAGDIIEAYLQLLQVWVLRDLPAIVEVVDKTGITDLSHLESSVERRSFDIYIRTTVSYTETKQAVNSAELDLSL